jgi:hypothetical protein
VALGFAITILRYFGLIHIQLNLPSVGNTLLPVEAFPLILGLLLLIGPLWKVEGTPLGHPSVTPDSFRLGLVLYFLALALGLVSGFWWLPYVSELSLLLGLLAVPALVIGLVERNALAAGLEEPAKPVLLVALMLLLAVIGLGSMWLVDVITLTPPEYPSRPWFGQRPTDASRQTWNYWITFVLIVTMVPTEFLLWVGAVAASTPQPQEGPKPTFLRTFRAQLARAPGVEVLALGLGLVALAIFLCALLSLLCWPARPFNDRSDGWAGIIIVDAVMIGLGIGTYLLYVGIRGGPFHSAVLFGVGILSYVALVTLIEVSRGPQNFSAALAAVAVTVFSLLGAAWIAARSGRHRLTALFGGCAAILFVFLLRGMDTSFNYHFQLDRVFWP